MITTTDPRTGLATETDIPETTDAEVATIARASAAAFDVVRRRPRESRALLLEACAAALEDHRDELVAIADRETGLGAGRLNGELTRCAYQFRLFADAVRDGGYLEATIDHAGDTPMGPGPELRRMLVPIGPVAVFGSSNFPFAFSVPGGDTASALASGATVVLKAHGSHVLTSRRAFEVLHAALVEAGAPDGILGIVYGQRAGAALVGDPAITAVGFTGSLATGRILLAIIESRPQPIPFYGELSSVNPLIVTEAAATTRGSQIAEGLFASFTGSAGQFCTKPGVAFLPRSADALVDELVARAQSAGGHPLLNSRILDSYQEIRQRLIADGGARLIAEGTTDDAGFSVAPSILEIDASAVTSAVTEEAFGPLIVIARYDDLDQVRAAILQIPNSLTATIHSEADEPDAVARLVDDVSDHVGRVVFDGFPTGVRVGWAQHHGGPWPATNTQHTSVGISAMRRFLRPFAWQNAPESVLPVELREGDQSVPRRIDGVLELARQVPTGPTWTGPTS
jgi:NADP-dependent aldehyde dehydrogenase